MSPPPRAGFWFRAAQGRGHRAGGARQERKRRGAIKQTRFLESEAPRPGEPLGGQSSGLPGHTERAQPRLRGRREGSHWLGTRRRLATRSASGSGFHPRGAHRQRNTYSAGSGGGWDAKPPLGRQADTPRASRMPPARAGRAGRPGQRGRDQKPRPRAPSPLLHEALPGPTRQSCGVVTARPPPRPGWAAHTRPIGCHQKAAPSAG